MTIKRFFIGLFALIILVVFILDRLENGMSEYDYLIFKQKHVEQIELVDSIYNSTLETSNQVDLFTQSYKIKKDSINDLIQKNTNNRLRVRRLVNQLEQANELSNLEKNTTISQYNNIIDSLKYIIEWKNDIIDNQESYIITLKKNLNSKINTNKSYEKNTYFYGEYGSNKTEIKDNKTEIKDNKILDEDEKCKEIIYFDSTKISNKND